MGEQEQGARALLVDDEPKARVLLVDDDASVRRDYSRALRKAGWDVDTATDGREAIETLGKPSQGPYGVIVSDISMPGLGGLAFLRAVQKLKLDVPVVLMTGSPDLQSAMEAVEYGAHRYLIKPIALSELIGTVKSAMHMHQLARLKEKAHEAIGEAGKKLGDRLALETRFDSALTLLRMEFQPIVNWPERRVFGYEALLRSAEPALATPADLLDAAERLKRVHDLGRAVRAAVAGAAGGAPDGVALFVNLHAQDLLDDELFSRTAPLASNAERVVLEITERAPLDGISGLGGIVAKLRNIGFRIALDDLGAGYAGLNTFTQLEPDFVKLDRALVSGVDGSARKRSVVRSMLRLCSDELGIQVVGEGVETADERDALGLDGCVLLQGYLFARPGRPFPSPSW